MGKNNTPLEKHFGEIPQAQLVPDTPEDHQTDKIRRILPPIEGRPSPFIALALTVTAAEAMLVQLCAFGRSVVAADLQ